jgi:hypothetical protein
MQETDAPVSSSTYSGLIPRPDESFPRTCPGCQRSFGDLDDFVARTAPIARTTGLMTRDDPAEGSIVLLMRNCACGTPLAVRCGDRRAGTEKGAFRRRRFETMVALLVDAGVQPGTAREELRRMLHE